MSFDRSGFQVPAGADLRVRPKHSVPARDCRGEPVGLPEPCGYLMFRSGEPPARPYNDVSGQVPRFSRSLLPSPACFLSASSSSAAFPGWV